MTWPHAFMLHLRQKLWHKDAVIKALLYPLTSTVSIDYGPNLTNVEGMGYIAINLSYRQFIIPSLLHSVTLFMPLTYLET